MRRVVLVMFLAVAHPAIAAVLLERVEVLGADPPAVRLRVSAPVLPAVVRELPADGERPARVYLDLPATTLAAGIPALVAGGGDLLRVRTGQFDPATVRIVLDFAVAARCVVDADGRTITVTMAGASARPAQSVRVPVPRLPRPTGPRGQPAGAIVLDAGHGGHDPGATGIDGLVEKAIALDVTRRLAERLAARVPNAVVLTRTDDTFLTIDERLAAATDAALFVSVHANAAADPTLTGVEVYYGGGGIETVASAPGSAVRFGLEMVRAIERRFPEARTVVRPGGFGVLARNAVPSVLVEVGYLTNPGDAAGLRDPRHRAVVADAVADGVTAFLAERRLLGIASR